MSEHVVRFTLPELGTVRLLCRAPGCNKVVEMPVGELLALRAHELGRCRLCGADFNPAAANVPPLAALAAGLRAALDHAKVVGVEFVLPAPGEG